MARIMIASHNPARDYQSDQLLALELQRKGHNVWIYKYLDNDPVRVCYIKPDILILPEIRCEYSLMLAEQAKEYGVKIVVKSCEFGISEMSLYTISEEYRRAIFGRLPLNHAVDLFIAWGEKMKKTMRGLTLIDPDKIVCCGGYQFDPYFLPPPPVEKPAKPVILFACGFAYADRNKEFSFPEADTDSPLHREFVEIDQRGRSAWLAMLPKVAEKLSDIFEIWVKPHPGERLEAYQAILRDKPVRIIDQMSGFMAMQYASILVHAGSTMAFEAYLKKIPAICYHNICQDELIAKLTECPADEDTLIKRLLAARDEEWHDFYNKEHIRLLCGGQDSYYGLVDGEGAARISAAVERLLPAKTNVPDVWQYPKEPLFLSKNIATHVMTWSCAGCKNTYYVYDQPNREMVKCPYCGIANVRISK